METSLAPIAKGKWQDTYIYPDGTRKVMPWKPNQIQNAASELFMQAAAFSSTSQNAPENGFLYLALGEGQASWDITPPTLNPADTTLNSEIDRISIVPATDIVYLDPTTESIVPYVTRMVQISILIDFNRGIGDLREFGLIFGNATTTLNTGKTFNWVRHTLITKQAHPNPTQILRTIRIKCLLPSEVTVL